MRYATPWGLGRRDDVHAIGGVRAEAAGQRNYPVDDLLVPPARVDDDGAHPRVVVEVEQLRGPVERPLDGVHDLPLRDVEPGLVESLDGTLVGRIEVRARLEVDCGNRRPGAVPVAADVRARVDAALGLLGLRLQFGRHRGELRVTLHGDDGRVHGRNLDEAIARRDRDADAVAVGHPLAVELPDDDLPEVTSEPQRVPVAYFAGHPRAVVRLPVECVEYLRL